MRSLLTLPGSFGNSGLPQTRQGVTDAFRVPHTLEKSGHFCFVSNPAGGVSSGRCYILTEHVLMFVRLRRPCLGRGACSVFFCALIPKQDRCSMFRFFLSSRYLRLRHRLFSVLTSSLCRAVSVAFLGALLVLPVLYFAEVM